MTVAGKRRRKACSRAVSKDGFKRRGCTNNVGEIQRYGLEMQQGDIGMPVLLLCFFGQGSRAGESRKWMPTDSYQHAHVPTTVSFRVRTSLFV